MEIIYKDSEIVVCIKPKGVLSTEDLSGKASMPSILRRELCIDEVFPVHRLDREVSGLMVFALTKQAAARLSADVMNSERFLKEYMAVACGIPESNNGILNDLLFKDSKKNKTYVVDKKRRGVKEARLEYRLVNIIGDKSVVRIRLFTGRTHQIRVQFASRKMSLLGDRKYGGESSENGIALYSVRLRFHHPTTNEFLDFEKIPDILNLI